MQINFLQLLLTAVSNKSKRDNFHMHSNYHDMTFIAITVTTPRNPSFLMLMIYQKKKIKLFKNKVCAPIKFSSFAFASKLRNVLNDCRPSPNLINF